MKENKVAAYLVAFILSCAILAGVVLLMRAYSAHSIQTFDECQAAGYPIMESYPEQCMADGRVFINDN